MGEGEDRGAAHKSNRKRPAGGILHWSPTSTPEELRAFYQKRLALFAKIFFWTFVILVIWVNLMYWIEPILAPANYQYINVVSGVGLVALGLVWRFVFVRQTLSQRGLFGWDTAFTVVVGCVLAFAGAMSVDKEANVASMVIWSLLIVFARVWMIPSRGARTLLITSGALLPQVACAIYIVLLVDEPLYMNTPRIAFVVGMTIYMGLAVLLAYLGSEVLYGLRRQVSEAAELGQYVLTRKIGAGGMGKVYLAKHKMLRRPVALKLLTPDKGGVDSLVRFEREVQLTSELTHPNTIRIYDYGRSPDQIFYYAMEYLEGINLEQLVQRYGRQPPGRVIHILEQVCGALDEAHSLGLIHRDVKPANIMLCQRGKNLPDFVKVLDFGLVKEIEHAAEISKLSIAGTPAYMAPEVIVSDVVDQASDIYSLGAVAFYLLTGRLVFTASTVPKMCLDHLSSVPEPPSRLTEGVPATLDRLILDCLEKKPEQRPGSVEELRERLSSIEVEPWTRLEALRWWEQNPIEEEAAQSKAPSANSITVDMSDRQFLDTLQANPPPVNRDEEE